MLRDLPTRTDVNLKLMWFKLYLTSTLGNEKTCLGVFFFSVLPVLVLVPVRTFKRHSVRFHSQEKNPQDFLKSSWTDRHLTVQSQQLQLFLCLLLSVYNKVYVDHNYDPCWQMSLILSPDDVFWSPHLNSLVSGESGIKSSDITTRGGAFRESLEMTALSLIIASSRWVQ